MVVAPRAEIDHGVVVGQTHIRDEEPSPTAREGVLTDVALRDPVGEILVVGETEAVPIDVIEGGDVQGHLDSFRAGVRLITPARSVSRDHQYSSGLKTVVAARWPLSSVASVMTHNLTLVLVL